MKSIHQLAREMGIMGQDIVRKCRAHGVLVRNHQQQIDAELEKKVRAWFRASDDERPA